MTPRNFQVIFFARGQVWNCVLWRALWPEYPVFVQKLWSLFHSKNHLIFNIICCIAGSMGQTTHWLNVWCSKYYWFSYFFIQNSLLLFLLMYKKINWKDFCKEFWKKVWKIIILGTSDTWSTSRLSHWPNEPAYYSRLTNF